VASEVDPGSAELSILPFCEWWAMRVSYSTRVYLCVGALPLIGRGGGRSRWKDNQSATSPKVQGAREGDVWMWARSNGQRSAPLFFSKQIITRGMGKLLGLLPFPPFSHMLPSQLKTQNNKWTSRLPHSTLV